MRRPWLTTTLVLGLLSGAAAAQVDLDLMVEQGEVIFNHQVGCWVRHSKSGEGLVGLSLLFGPTPAQIFEQMMGNPQMAIIEQVLAPDNEDLIAVAMYIRTLAGLPLDEDMTVRYRKELVTARARQETDLVFPKTERDLAVEEIQSFDTVLADWQRRSK